MFKVMGGLLVVIATGFTGWSMARIYARRPQELRLFIAALQLLETEIVYLATPLPDALHRVARQLDIPVALFFRQVANQLSANKGYTAKEAWHLGLDGYYLRSALGRGDIAILRGLGNCIGATDQDDQEKHLRLAKEQLKAALVVAENSASKNVKMWHYLGLLGGLMIVLTLY